MNHVETFHGHIDSTADALRVIQLCRLGQLGRVRRRLHDHERRAIRSGSVFVFDEQESKIKRWTDGRLWSPSRILGNFLVYRELQQKITTGMHRKTEKTKKEEGQDTLYASLLEDIANNVSGSDQTTNMNATLTAADCAFDSSSTMQQRHRLDSMDSGIVSDVCTSIAPSLLHDKSNEMNIYESILGQPRLTGDLQSQSPPPNVMLSCKLDTQPRAELAWPPPSHIWQHALATRSQRCHASLDAMQEDSYIPEQRVLGRRRRQSRRSYFSFKENGLIKKTLAVTVDGHPWHLVCYYTREDALSGLTHHTLWQQMKSLLDKVQIPNELWRQPGFRGCGESAFDEMDSMSLLYPESMPMTEAQNLQVDSSSETNCANLTCIDGLWQKAASPIVKGSNSRNLMQPSWQSEGESQDDTNLTTNLIENDHYQQQQLEQLQHNATMELLEAMDSSALTHPAVQDTLELETSVEALQHHFEENRAVNAASAVEAIQDTMMNSLLATHDASLLTDIDQESRSTPIHSTLPMNSWILDHFTLDQVFHHDQNTVNKEQEAQYETFVNAPPSPKLTCFKSPPYRLPTPMPLLPPSVLNHETTYECSFETTLPPKTQVQPKKTRQALAVPLDTKRRSLRSSTKQKVKQDLMA